MPRETRSLLFKAVPRLERGDAKAEKLEQKLLKLGASLWNKGPRALGKLGVKLEDEGAHRELEPGELLDGAREALGDRELVRFLRKVFDVLQRKLAEKKTSTDGAEGSRRSSREDGSRRSSREDGSRRSSREDGSRRSSREAGRDQSARREKRREEPEGRGPREAAKSGRTKKEGPGKERRREPVEVAPVHEEPAAELTMSGEDSGEELAIPADSGEGLALPEDSDVLAIPGEAMLEIDPDEGGGGLDEVDLDDLQLEVAPRKVAADEPRAAAPVLDEGPSGDDAQDADRALARYGRTGDPGDLAEAKKLYKVASKNAEGPVATGAVRGGLARVYFLEGDLEKARDMAKKALKAFPHDPVANAVLCQVEWPQEVERERLTALLARAESALSTSDYDELKAVAKQLEKAHPKEPFGPLLLLAIECDKLSEDLAKPLGEAWRRYPASPAFADILLGPRLERVLIDGCLRWIEREIDKDEAVRGNTVKDIDSPDNVHAGAFQLALGLGRAAVCGRRKLEKEEHQQLIAWVGRALFFAQHYDYAKDVFGAAAKVDRESSMVGDLRRLETQCGVMKRAFDKPGVKFKSGKLDGVGIERYREAVAARLKQVLGDLEGDRGKLDAREAKLVDAILADPARKKAIQKAAKKAELDDPFAVWDALEAEAGALAARSAEPPKKAGGGLFGRVKAAAQGAIDKAKAAAQGAVVASRKAEARRAMGERLRQGPDGGWGDAELDGFLAKAALIEPRLDYLESVAEDLRAAAGRAGEL
ncbi:MAG: hypothetical protein AB7N76_01560 [Planctomycetota bacterium]